MMSIHNNLPALNVTRNLASNMRTQSSAMEKLSSGFRINKAADDPSGLVLSEKLRAQIEGLDRAIRNTDDTDSLLGVMEGGLGQVQNIIREMQKLAVASANSGITTVEQTSSYQAQLDNGLLAINDILQTTNMGGRKVLNNVNLFGGGNVGAGNSGTPISKDGEPKQSTFDSLLQNGLGADYTMSLKGLGENGDQNATLRFTKGQSLDDVLAQLREFDISALQEEDGEAAGLEGMLSIHAGFLNADTLKNLKTMDDDAAKDFLAEKFSSRMDGVANNLGGGMQLSKQEQMLSDLSESLSTVNLGSLGGGSVMVESGEYDSEGNPIMKGYSLNDLFSGGDASLSRDPALALKILKGSYDDVAGMRAQIGATRAMNEYWKMTKQSELENVTKMESMIRDTDFATTVAEYSKAEILGQMGTRLLRDAVDSSKMILDLFA